VPTPHDRIPREALASAGGPRWGGTEVGQPATGGAAELAALQLAAPPLASRRDGADSKTVGNRDDIVLNYNWQLNKRLQLTAVTCRLQLRKVTFKRRRMRPH
jgi:hypothetical protein